MRARLRNSGAPRAAAARRERFMANLRGEQQAGQEGTAVPGGGALGPRGKRVEFYFPPRGSIILRFHLEIHFRGAVRLDLDGVALLVTLVEIADLLLPGYDAVFPGGGLFDLEVAVLVGHGEVRVVEDPDPGPHPAVDAAIDLPRRRRDRRPA